MNIQDTNNNSKVILDIETTSFEPWSGKIICIGVKDANDGETNVFYDEHEESLLLLFFKHMNKKKYREVIGFNLSFDMRFIFARCLKYKLPVISKFANSVGEDFQ